LMDKGSIGGLWVVKSRSDGVVLGYYVSASENLTVAHAMAMTRGIRRRNSQLLIMVPEPSDDVPWRSLVFPVQLS
jgi:hypothetical protein